VVVTPVSRGDSVDPLRLPLPVHLLLPRRPWSADVERFASEDLWLVARARLVSTWSQAEATDRSMQRMHGPRR
jgi:hypothetical protein